MIIFVRFSDRKLCIDDAFTRGSFVFENAVASFKVGRSVKTEGELVVSGTDGCIYVPSPWWKTDYFEVRKENADENRRFFYQLDGEGIRNQLAVFLGAVERGHTYRGVSKDESIGIARMFELAKKQANFINIK